MAAGVVLRTLSSRHRAIAVAVALFAAAILFGPLIWRFDPEKVSLTQRLLSPSFEHPFGTDQFGRDVLARVLWGARLSTVFALTCVACSALIGAFLGFISGFLAGWVDQVISRLLDAILAFPALILAIAMAIALKPGPVSAGAGIILVSIPWYARRVRSEVLSLRARPYVEAAYVYGASTGRIIFRHLVPALAGGVVAQASLGVGFAVMTLAALGFLGLGVQPPTPEWGSMITDGRRYLLSGHWWISFFPGLGIVTLVVMASIVGNALTDSIGRESS
jgi:peptide/nickel transport system permease protein